MCTKFITFSFNPVHSRTAFIDKRSQNDGIDSVVVEPNDVFVDLVCCRFFKSVSAFVIRICCESTFEVISSTAEAGKFF